LQAGKFQEISKRQTVRRSGEICRREVLARCFDPVDGTRLRIGLNSVDDVGSGGRLKVIKEFRQIIAKFDDLDSMDVALSEQTKGRKTGSVVIAEVVAQTHDNGCRSSRFRWTGHQATPPTKPSGPLSTV
jgi:hypothetical protein